MKLNSLLFAGLCIFALTACDGKDEPAYTPASTPSENQRVHFAQATMNLEVQQQESGSFEVTIQRVKGTEAKPLTVQLVPSCSTPEIIGAGVEVPTSVTFAEGKTSTIFTVNYDSNALEVAKPYDIAIAIAENGNEYSISTLNIKLEVSQFSPWAPFANATGAGTINLNILFEGSAPCTVFYRESTIDAAAKEFRVEEPDAFEAPFYIYTQDGGNTLSIPAQGVLTDSEYGLISICDLTTYKKNPAYNKYNLPVGRINFLKYL